MTIPEAVLTVVGVTVPLALVSVEQVREARVQARREVTQPRGQEPSRALAQEVVERLEHAHNLQPGHDGRSLAFRTSHGARAAIYYHAVALVTEQDRGRDLNGDGDLEDRFELGELRQASALDLGPVIDGAVGGATVVLPIQQEGEPAGCFQWDVERWHLELRWQVLTRGAEGSTLQPFRASFHPRGLVR